MRQIMKNETDEYVIRLICGCVRIGRRQGFGRRGMNLFTFRICRRGRRKSRLRAGGIAVMPGGQPLFELLAGGRMGLVEISLESL